MGRYSPDCKLERGGESRSGKHNPLVVGSSPTGPTRIINPGFTPGFIYCFPIKNIYRRITAHIVATIESRKSRWHQNFNSACFQKTGKSQWVCKVTVLNCVQTLILNMYGILTIIQCSICAKIQYGLAAGNMNPGRKRNHRRIYVIDAFNYGFYKTHRISTKLTCLLALPR